MLLSDEIWLRFDVKKYPRFFLEALATWQRGWTEDADLRRKLALNLREAIAAAENLPIASFRCSVPCYRKRFLVPNNPQNGGDFWPLFVDGEIMEGIASWTTNYEFSKLEFKKELRPGLVATMFETVPKQDEVVLNVPALWDDPDFVIAVDNYVSGGGEAAGALRGYRHQSEVILRAPLRFNEIKAFCEKVPSLESLCQTAGISSEEDEDALWQKLVEHNLLETTPYWLEDLPAKRAAQTAALKFYERMAERVKNLHI